MTAPALLPISEHSCGTIEVNNEVTPAPLTRPGVRPDLFRRSNDG